MADFIQSMFGEFGGWAVGGIGGGVIASLGFVSRQFLALKPRTLEMKSELQALSQMMDHLQSELEHHKTEVGAELEKITVKDDHTRKRLDDIHARLDHFVGQTAVNYQALSEQISSMQRGLLGKQDEIIEKQAEMIREYQRDRH